MPDTKIRIVHGAWPQDLVRTMREGDKILWIPDQELRRSGCAPVLSVFYRPRGYRYLQTDYLPQIPGMMGNG